MDNVIWDMTILILKNKHINLFKKFKEMLNG